MATQRPRRARAPKERREVGPLWPVQLAIVALAGSIAVLVMSNGDFPNLRAILDGGWPRLLRSSWLHLTADAALLTILLRISPRLRGISRRRTELAVLVSLIAHFWLAVYLHQECLPLSVAQSLDLPGTPGRPLGDTLLPDYNWQGVDRVGGFENFQRPAQTLPSRPSKVAQAQPQATEGPSKASLPRSAEPMPRPLPDKTEITRAHAPQPQRRESAVARLARHEAAVAGPVQQAAMPTIREASPPAERMLQPTSRTESTRRREAIEPAAAASRAAPLRMPSMSLADAAASPLRNDAIDPLPLQQAAAPQRASAPSARLEVEPAEVPAVAESAEATERSTSELQARTTPSDSALAPSRLSVPSLPKSESADSSPMESTAPAEVDPARERVARAATLRRDEPTASMPAASLPRSAVAADSPSLASSGSAGVPGLPGTLRVEEPLPLPAGSGGGRGGAGARRIAGGGTGGGNSGGAVRAASYDETGEGNGPGAGYGHGDPGGVRGSSAGSLLPVAADALRPRMPGGGGIGGNGGRGAGGGNGHGGAGSAIGGAVGSSNEGGGGAADFGDLPSGASVGGSSQTPAGATVGAPGSPGGSGGGRGLAMGKSGGVPSIDAGVTDTPAQMYLQRDPERRGRMARSFGAGDDTERAVELGIGYLLRHQFPDGRWAIDRFPQGQRESYADASPGNMNADTAATGLALLALLGAGYTHRDGKHQVEVRRAIDWLVAHQQSDGRLGDERTDAAPFARLYGHAMAAIALCEAYGMTADPALREPAQNAVRFIVASQHSELGGWRYAPGEESDTSVSGWKLMALRSAQVSGLEVPKQSLVRVGLWLDAAQSDRGARYAYNPYAANMPEQIEGRKPSLAMTAEGLLMRMYLGWDRKQPGLVEGAEWLSAHPPAMGSAAEPSRDAYYWYYATQVMFQLQGNAWQQWNARMRPLLVESQQKTGPLSGSWHPEQPVPDRWASAGGRHYVTAMHLLMLEVYYRHLPLYRLEAH